MNKSLKNIKGEEDTLKLFFSKTIKLISLDICQAPPGSLLLHGEYETFRTKIGNASFKKDIFLVYPTSTNFAQRKRKPYDTNNLLTPSLVNIIVCIYSLGKKFCCTYLKTTLWDDIFF